MRIVVLLLSIFVIAFKSKAQKSDLEVATHEFEYVGDSLKLKKIVKILQSDSIDVIAKNIEICELKIIDVGTTKTMKFSVYHIEYGPGVSCRGSYRTVFFNGESFVGYYVSDIAPPDKIDGDQLIWDFERNNPLFMDLSKEIPNHFLFGEFKRELYKN